jgi:hypothetical protein
MYHNFIDKRWRKETWNIPQTEGSFLGEVSEIVQVWLETFEIQCRLLIHYEARFKFGIRI